MELCSTMVRSLWCSRASMCDIRSISACNCTGALDPCCSEGWRAGVRGVPPTAGPSSLRHEPAIPLTRVSCPTLKIRGSGRTLPSDAGIAWDVLVTPDFTAMAWGTSQPCPMPSVLTVRVHRVAWPVRAVGGRQLFVCNQTVVDTACRRPSVLDTGCSTEDGIVVRPLVGEADGQSRAAADRRPIACRALLLITRLICACPPPSAADFGRLSRPPCHPTLLQT